MSIPLPSQVKFAPKKAAPSKEEPESTRSVSTKTASEASKPSTKVEHVITIVEFSWGTVGECSCGEFRSSIETDVKRHLALNKRKPIYGKRPDHLQQRPFQENAALKALRDSLSEGPKGQVSPNPDKRKNRRAARP